MSARPLSGSEGCRATHNRPDKGKAAGHAQLLTMTIDELLAYLNRAVNPSPDTTEDAEWHEYQDAYGFLNSCSTAVPLYASCGGPGHTSHVYLYSLSIPRSTPLGLTDIDDILGWNFGVGEVHTGISIHGGLPGKGVSLSGPLEGAGSRILQSGSPLFYLRTADPDSPATTNYLELDSAFSQAIDVHEDRRPFPTRRQTWKHYTRGVGQDVVQGGISPTFLSVNRPAIDLFLKASNERLVRVFDFVRAVPSRFTMWKGAPEGKTRVEPPGQTFARHHIQRKDGAIQASFLRGFQVIDSSLTAEQAAQLAETYW